MEQATSKLWYTLRCGGIGFVMAQFFPWYLGWPLSIVILALCLMEVEFKALFTRAAAKLYDTLIGRLMARALGRKQPTDAVDVAGDTSGEFWGPVYVGESGMDNGPRSL